MHQLADSKSKEACVWSEFCSSYSLPTSFPEKVSKDPATFRSRFSSHQEEISDQVGTMAGANPLSPSYAPCLVESSAAHDGHLVLVLPSGIGDHKTLGFSFDASSPAINLHPTSSPSSEMFYPLKPMSLQSGRRLSNPLHPTGKLGVSLVDPPILGPLRQLSPLTQGVSQELSPHVPRFEQNSTLFHSSQSLCRFIKPLVRRLHLVSKLPLVASLVKDFLDNLLLVPPRVSAFGDSSLNIIGIMIQSIGHCGYRCMFRLPPLTRLNPEPDKLLIINFLKFPSKNLKISGIMIPIQCNGGYHNTFKCFPYEPKTATTPLHILNQSTYNPAQTFGKALLWVSIFFVKMLSALDSSTPFGLRSKTMAISSSIEVSMEEASIFLDLTGSKSLARNWLIALKSTISMNLINIYLLGVLVLISAFLCCILNNDPYAVCCVLC